MKEDPSYVDIIFDESDKILLRGMLTKNSRSSYALGFGNILESIQVGMSGELVVFKWLKSSGLEVALQTIENPNSMKSDIHIVSKHGTYVKLEVKTSTRNSYPIIPFEQVQRIQNNSDYIIFCQKISNGHSIRISDYIRTSDLSKLRECKIIKEDGDLIHFLKIEDYFVIPITDFLTEIKAWKITNN